jgi:hypothetical protein
MVLEVSVHHGGADMVEHITSHNYSQEAQKGDAFWLFLFTHSFYLDSQPMG